ncbi:MAG TPA: hypothetical protein PKA42_02865 [Candidatus Paceibacterota bacterium]|nr:hypothetical protein [Candidatus Paceibacterota bacterium]HMO83087.1 hypothetical protein [Candidatus Paceibacterota bacterium]
MKTKALAKNNHFLTSLCVGFFIMSILGYMYFLSLSVVHVVMRKEATQEISHLRSEIANLEAEYIEAKHQISARVATMEGYKNNQDKIFISKAEKSLVLQTAGF